jgi:hypothetical protein
MKVVGVEKHLKFGVIDNGGIRVEHDENRVTEFL